MNDKPRQFALRLALVVTPAEEARRVVPDLQEQLDVRSYLGSPRVLWDEHTQHVIVEVRDKNLDAERAAQLMSEELFEAATAVLNEFDTMHIEILDVTEA